MEPELALIERTEQPTEPRLPRDRDCPSPDQPELVYVPDDELQDLAAWLRRLADLVEEDA